MGTKAGMYQWMVRDRMDRLSPIPTCPPVDSGETAEAQRDDALQFVRATRGMVQLVFSETDVMANPEDQAECPICGTVAAMFDSGGQPPRSDSRCPKCVSNERYRALWLYLRERTRAFTDPVRMLHIAPEGPIARLLRERPNIDYVSTDLNPALAMMSTDLTCSGIRDGSFDLVIASHVLEHIPDDLAAMRELRRVLGPGGVALLAVPMFGRTTREDLTVTDPAERQRLYGQHDHVRMYGLDGVFEQRLRAAGFDVTCDQFVRDLDPETKRRYRLSLADHQPLNMFTYAIFRATFDVPVVPAPPIVHPDPVAADGAATVSWSPPVRSTGPAVSSYVVTPYVGLGPLEPVIVSARVTTATVSGLDNGTTYRFKVGARNAIGEGQPSFATNPVVPQCPAGK